MEIYVGLDGLISPTPALGSILLLYTGPETIIPLVSALAAIVGFLLMLWRRVVGVVRAAFQYCRKKVSPLIARNKTYVRSEGDPDSHWQR